MIYDDYKWNAAADKDNPYYRNGSDHTLLNRTEGYEVLYFINHLSEKLWTTTASTYRYNQLEKLIRIHPTNIRSHLNVETWIIANWSNY